MAFHANAQLRLLDADTFDAVKSMGTAMRKQAPWESVVDFATHRSFCNTKLYPRQHTMLKLMFLETEHMTAYDLDVIEEWRQGFTRRRDVFGVQPDIWERIAYLKARGARRFPHIQFIGGRRGSKGLTGGLLGAEQIAYYFSLDNWQRHYGVDEGKDGFLQVGATSQTQAKAQLFADVRSMVERCAYLQPHIAESKDHQLAVRTRADVLRIAEMQAARVPIDHQIATLRAQALSASAASFRGATAFGMMLDEFAFMVETGSNKSGQAIYEGAHPSLDQFDLDGLCYVPSSPFTKSGHCYQLYQQGSVLMSSYADHAGVGDRAQAELATLASNQGTEAVEVEANPTMLIVHLPSWGAYLDHERGKELVGITFKRAIQPGPEHESQIRRKMRNPEAFQVERAAQWAEVLGAYFDPDMVDKMFVAPTWRPALEPQSRGLLTRTYRIHCDPSVTGANFAMCIGHTEQVCDTCSWSPENTADPHPKSCTGHPRPHVIIDLLHVWRPQDFPPDPVTGKPTVDYVKIREDLEGILRSFPSTSGLSFDQCQSQGLIQELRRQFSPTIRVSEVTFTEKSNQERFEKVKAALNQGWVSSYSDQLFEDGGCLLESEMKFLSLKAGRVVKQNVGPVTTKDLFDCHDDQTEVLTEHGWKLFRDVLPDERVATRSPEGLLEYQLPIGRVSRHYAGPMYACQDLKFDFVVTPGHRMLGGTNPGQHNFCRADELPRAPFHVPRLARSAACGGGTTHFQKLPLGEVAIDRSRVDAARLRVRWTPDEDSFLSANYSAMSMAEICATLKRTRSTIYNRAKALGLRRGQIGDRVRGNGPGLPECKTIDFARFLGIWLAEGRRVRGIAGNGVYITQTKQEGIDWIDAAIQRLGWPVLRAKTGSEVRWRVLSKELKDFLLTCQGDGHELRIPDFVFTVWSAEEQEALLEGLMVGDGSFRASDERHYIYTTNSYQLASDVQRLILHIGRASARIKKVYDAGPAVGTRHKANHPLWNVLLDHSQYSRLHRDRIRQVDYSGMVYCLQVPNSTLLTRRGGRVLWSGNCVAVVVEDLLHGELERYGANSNLATGAYGSTNIEGLRSGTDLERMGAQGMNRARQQMAELTRGRGRPSYTPNRASTIGRSR